MSSLRLAAVSIVSLCVGGVIGYWLHPASTPAASITAAKTASTSAVAAVPTTTASAASASPASTTAGAKAPTEASGARSPSIRERLALLRWQRSLGPTPFVQLFSGRNVNPTIVKYLDLSPAEEARLAAATREAEEQIGRLRDAGASSRLSDDRKQLVVEVPGLDADTSRTIYDRFNAEIAATLDPDRLELLNHLTGESTDRLHDRFGLNSVRFELKLEPRRLPDGRIFYDYRRHFIDADGTSRGWSDNNQPLEDIVKTAPVLARFLAAQSPAPKP